MMYRLAVPLLLIGLALGILSLWMRVQHLTAALPSPTPTHLLVSPTPADCVPTFADGGGPYYKTGVPFRQKIVPDVNAGEKLIVSGQVLERDCRTPVPNAVLDLWQANESGNYEDSWYRGKVRTDSAGYYTFITVVPKGYGEGTAFRPPHIHFKVFRDDREIITSQMFFPESRGSIDNAYIMNVDELTAADGSREFMASHPIILP